MDYIKQEPDEMLENTLQDTDEINKSDVFSQYRVESQIFMNPEAQQDHINGQRLDMEIEIDEDLSIGMDELFGESPAHVGQYDQQVYRNFFDDGFQVFEENQLAAQQSLKRKTSDASISGSVASNSNIKKFKLPVLQAGTAVDEFAQKGDSSNHAITNEEFISQIKQKSQENLCIKEPEPRASLENEKEEAEKKLASVEKDRDEAYEREASWLCQIQDLENQLGEAKTKQAATEQERNEGFGEAAKWYDQMQDVILERDTLRARITAIEQNRRDSCDAFAKLKLQFQQLLNDRTLWRGRCLQMVNASKAARGQQQQQQGQAVPGTSLTLEGQQQGQAVQGRSLTLEEQQRLIHQRQFIHPQNMQKQAAQRQFAQQLLMQQQQSRTPQIPTNSIQFIQHQQILTQQQHAAHANHQAQRTSGQQMQPSIQNIPSQQQKMMVPGQNMVMGVYPNMGMNQGQMGNNPSGTMNG